MNLAGTRPAFTLVALAGLAGHPAQAVTTADYARADRIRALDPRLEGGHVEAHWLKDGERFYFRAGGRDEGPGTYFLVDPRRGTKRELFRGGEIAPALSALTSTAIRAAALPAFELIDNETRVVFEVSGRKYECVTKTSSCGEAGGQLDRTYRSLAVPPFAVRSPDGRWDAFIYDHNVYIRPASLDAADMQAWRMPDQTLPGGNARFGALLQDSLTEFVPTGQREGCDQGAPPGPIDRNEPALIPPPDGSLKLTSDGERGYSYGRRWKLGAEVATLDVDRYRPSKGGFAWSPDSQKLLVRREDIRGVGTYPLYSSSTTTEPVDHSYYYATPGAQSIPQYDFAVIDVEKRAVTKLDVPPTGLVLRPGGAQWSKDSRELFVLSSDRAPHEVRLSRVNAASGRTQPIVRETSKTSVEMSNGDDDTIVAVVGEEVFWYAERDGWGHLYRYSTSGEFRNQVERGNYSVAELTRVDSRHQWLYFTAWGKEPGIPYYRHLYRIDFEGSNLHLLTPETGDHHIEWSPGGDFFLDTFSTVDTPARTVLRRLDGRQVMEVSKGSDAVLREAGWNPAEAFTVKARDGRTDLYGVMFKPGHFDPGARYPVITNLYPGPFTGSVGRDWGFQGADNIGRIQGDGTRPTHGEGMGQSLAELGFIVIKLDALGSSRRQRSMQDFFYGNAIDNGLPDQIAAIRQLAARFPWIDAERVGIFGHSGGGYAAAAGMLRYPEFFKVGVAEAGNHDFRSYGWYWGEKYQGPRNSPEDERQYEAQANYPYAANLKGRLLLMHGDMDCNNPMAQTMRLVDALIKEQKPFDMLIVPEAGHQLPPYAMKRAWDYFVEYLKGEPPRLDYKPVDRPL